MSEVFAHYSTWLARTAEYHAQGYRNPTCVHGMPVCFESDISCGACEDEDSPEDFTFEDALEVAQDRIDEYDNSLTAYFGLIRYAVELSRKSGKPREFVRHVVEVHTEDARRRIARAEDSIIFA